MNASGIWTLEEAKQQHAHSEPLAKALVKYFKSVKAANIYDFGCGKGYYARAFEKAGFAVRAFEGTPTIRSIGYFQQIEFQDLTEAFTLEKKGAVLCLEVGEHIPAEHESTLLDNITRNAAGHVVLSWAVPGQGGYGHVNEREKAYIISKMTMRGWAINTHASLHLRKFAGNCWWFQNTIMVFDEE